MLPGYSVIICFFLLMCLSSQVISRKCEEIWSETFEKLVASSILEHGNLPCSLFNPLFADVGSNYADCIHYNNIANNNAYDFFQAGNYNYLLSVQDSSERTFPYKSGWGGGIDGLQNWIFSQVQEYFGCDMFNNLYFNLSL